MNDKKEQRNWLTPDEFQKEMNRISNIQGNLAINEMIKSHQNMWRGKEPDIKKPDEFVEIRYQPKGEIDFELRIDVYKTDSDFECKISVIGEYAKYGFNKKDYLNKCSQIMKIITLGVISDTSKYSPDEGWRKKLARYISYLLERKR